MAKFLKWLRIIICLWLVSICIFALLVMSFWNLMNYWHSSKWVQVTAKINSIEITNTFNGRTATNWSGTNNNFLCEYTYSLGGQTFSGNRGNIETYTTDSERHSEYRFLKDELDGNKPITIWVNPTVPAESVLFRGHDLFVDLYLLIFGLIWFGALLWYYKFRMKKGELGNEQK
jgi:hypothetical protein